MDKVQRKKRCPYLTVLVLSVLLAIVGLSLYPPKPNFNLFYTPSQIAEGLVANGQFFRLNGQVKNIIKQNINNLQISFVVADTQHNVLVDYEGVLPSLFSPGKSIVVEGNLNKVGIMQAKRVTISLK